ncbi:LytR/AlgR family response regulator transcription factor [Rhizosphaericola mali]|uniref:Response regulator transcription factor n=1 Tax=Rhizosphaericola mali TaxID=2545455 RepID=A0A5P2G0I3_9BACT|nr:LytTR family DNA-binding domain-containing protein [Rhizosphaericola mali]QES88945.1 response regulator transcription factor [Rhizosphaericola mali]
MNCIIIDDEPLAREAIAQLLSDCTEINIIGQFSSPLLAKDSLDNVDLIFLDINMPGVNGLEFAKQLKESDTLIIFTTAYEEYALDSYEVDAIDYLVKPIVKERFEKAIRKAINYHQLLHSEESISSIETNVSDTEDYFFIRADRKIHKVNYNEVLYIEGLKDYVIVHTNSQKIIAAMNIKTIYQQLPQNTFFRISKSYIINVQHITALDNNSVFIQNDEIPIGNIYREAFYEAYVEKRIFKR